MGNVWAVFIFEWKRALTVPRMAWWAVLAAFPVFIVGLIRVASEIPPPYELWAGFLFALVPMLVTMLGSILWMTPVVSAELERRSWVYLAIRPNGSTAVVLGKYLAAVSWIIPASVLGASIAVPLTASGDGWTLWWAMARLAVLSCPAYTAVYLLLGVIMPRRAMVLAVAYTLIFELIISFIPAVVNKLTVQYRLRALFIDWCDITIPDKDESGVLALIGDSPPYQHVTTLVLISVVLLALAVVVLKASEFSSSAESDI